MTYKSYKARIQRIAAVTRGLRKCAKLIAVVVLTALVGTGGYLFARGLTIGGVTCAPVLTYGEDMNPSAVVLLDKASYEYAPMDSEEWTTEAPTMPGSYRVRAVTKRSFGLVSRSKPTTFTIEPKKVTVTVHEDSLHYGDAPSVSVELREGDTVEYVGLEYNNLSLNPTLIHIPQGSIKIVNQKGEDVTGAYEIVTKDKVVDITPRPITITVPSASKVYDGTPLVSHEWTLSAGSLMEGDVLDLTFDASVTYVSDGTKDNTPAGVVVKNAKDVDVSTHYEITLDCGTLSVTPYPLSYSTNSASWMYGFPAGKLGFENEPVLPAGHTRTADIFETPVSAGTYTNACSFRILNAAGVDVTDGNFTLQPTWGTVTIEPRPLMLVTPSASKVYDGNKLSRAKAESKDEQTYHMLDGHEIKVVLDSVTELIDVGTAENQLAVQIVDAAGGDVTANYAIEFEYGTLTVTKRPLMITTGSAEKIYDGLPLSSTEVAEADGLVPGHIITVLSSTQQILAGEVVNTFDSIEIKRESDGGDVLGNYEVSYNAENPGMLVVTKLSLTVDTPSGEFTYDGAAHGSSAKDDIGGVTLPADHSWQVASGTEITNVGQADNVIAIQVTNASGDDVTDSFDFHYSYGILTVNRRILTITPNAFTKVYDGEALECRKFTTGANELVDGHIVVLPDNETYPSIVNVGTVQNLFPSSGYKIMAGDTDVTENYSITVANDKCGMLEITKRPITVTPLYAEQEYDATELTCDTPDYKREELVEGHKIAIDTDGTGIAVGEHANAIIKLVITDSDGKSMNENYDITQEVGTLKITPRHITVQMSNGEWEYTDGIFSNPDFTVTSDTKLVDGHEWADIQTTTVRNVAYANGEVTWVPNQLVAWKIMNGGEDVSSNYQVDFVDGELTVMPKPLKIDTGSKNQHYDGSELTCTTFEQVGLLDGHTIEVLGSTQLILADDVPNEFTSIKITRNEDDEDVTANYAVSYKNGRLRVDECPIVITTPGGTFVYDGQPHSRTDGVYAELPEHHELKVLDAPEITEVGWIYNDIGEEDILVTNGEGDDVTACFNIINTSTEWEKLVVSPRPIKVTSSNAHDPFVYDGTPKSYSDWEMIVEGDFLNLVDGHTMTVTTDGEWIDAGCWANNITAVVIQDATGADVTANYDPETVQGEIWIQQRPITIAPQDEEETYNGEALTGDIPDVRGSASDLLTGHYIVITTNGSQINVGEAVNEITGYTIYDANNNNVTANYDISHQPGLLKVTPRPLTITTGSDSKVYDGTPLSCTTYTDAVGLLAGHTILVDPFSVRTDVGSEDNVWTVTITSDAGDVTRNYEIFYEYGTLTVLSPVVNVTTPSGQFVYDGTAHSMTDGVYLDEILPDGHSWVIDHATIAEIKDVGTDDNVIAIRITNEQGTDVTSQFTIEYTYGKLTVTKRPIKVTSNNAHDPIVYDGTPKSYNGWETIVEGDFLNLVDGHAMTVTTDGLRTDVGHEVNNITAVVIQDATGADVTANYDPETVQGEIWIRQRPITIAPQDEEEEYDGEALLGTTPEVQGSASDLLTGHYIVITTNGEQINVGESVNEITDWTIYDANHNNVTANYDVSTETGILKVTPKSLTITTDSASKVYDGTPLSCMTYMDAIGLIDGHTITVNSAAQLILVDTVPNEFTSVKITRDSDGVDVSGNYAIDYVGGELTVEKCPLMVKTEDGTFEYDGNAHSMTEGLTVSLPAGHRWEIASYTDIEKVGTLSNEITITVFNEQGEDVTFCFAEPATEFGTLTMTARPILVTSSNEDAPFIYNGMAQTYSVGRVLDEEGFKTLLDGHTLRVTTEGTRTEPGESINKVLTVTVLDGAGEDVTANYSITKVDGKVCVKKGSMTIAPDNVEKIYDGTELTSKNDVMLVSGALLEGYRIEITTEGSQILVGVGQCIIQTYVIYDENGNDVTDCYEVTTNTGTLTVTQRPVTFTTPSAQMIYVEGQVLSAPECTLTSGALISGHWVQPSNFASISEPGVAQNSCVVSIFDENSVDVTANYEINYEFGTLTVLAAGEREHIEIRPYEINVTYDGKAHGPEGDEYWISAGSLPAGYTITNVVYTDSHIDAGNYTSRVVDLTILNEYGDDVTNQFEISTPEALLIIQKRDLTIQTGSLSVRFNGKTHSNKSYTISGGSLVDGHSIEIEMSTSISKYGSVYNVIDRFILTDSNGESSYETGADTTVDCQFFSLTNYNITFQYGTLEVRWS